MLDSIVARIAAVIFIFICLWISGFILQKTSNSSQSNDYNIKSKSQWVRLLGLYPGKGKVYIRFAFIQMLAIFFLVAGLIIVVWYEEKTLSLLFRWLTIPFGIGALFFIIMDIFRRTGG